MLELDKIKTSIDDRYFKKNKQENKGMYIGFNYNIADNKLYFEVSGNYFQHLHLLGQLRVKIFQIYQRRFTICLEFKLIKII